MNAYREMITVSREVARQARERGVHIQALHLLDAAREAEAQLARDENDRDNLRHLLSELFAPAPEVPCSGCGKNRHDEAARAIYARRNTAEAQLRRLLERLGGPKTVPRTSLDREAAVRREAEDFYGRQG